jgi:DNA-binding transcriptional LysR family regulator
MLYVDGNCKYMLYEVSYKLEKFLTWEEKMNLYHLRVFKTVAEHEHITRASEELILSQPAVTKIIQSLEQDTGLELIERHGRRIFLTYAGRVLHSYARRMFALEREMEEALTMLRDVETGEINLAANTTTGVYLLPSIVSRYRNLYPRVSLYITILNSSEIIEQTLNWTLDFGLVEGDPATLPPGLHVEVFAQDELLLVVSPDHHWSKLDELNPEALREGELLLREQGSGIREVIEHALMLRGVQVSGNLVHVPIAGVNLRPQLSLVRRIDKQLSQAAQAFCALLKTTNESCDKL